MKRYYYFSHTKLKFEEIKKFKGKVAIGLLIASIFFGAVISTSIYFVFRLNNPEMQIEYLKKQNKLLVDKLETYEEKILQFDEEFNNLQKTNKQLRLRANLEPLDEIDYEVGIGGSRSENYSEFSSVDVADLVSNLDNLVNSLSHKLTIEKKNYNEIVSKFEFDNELYDAIPAIAPINAQYGDRFGLRFHPILKITRMHNGLDFIADVGTNVYAPGNAIVTFAGQKEGYGNTLILNHGFGYTTVYAHLNSIDVKEGQKVKRGDLIATSGNSGQLTTGPHLHYEVRHNGIALNPRNFIYDDIKLFDYLSIRKNSEVTKR